MASLNRNELKLLETFEDVRRRFPFPCSNDDDFLDASHRQWRFVCCQPINVAAGKPIVAKVIFPRL
jgi:hypothetical protein